MRKLALLLAVLVLGAGATAATAQGTPGKLVQLLPAEVGRKACYARLYDETHLRAHPQQRVTAVRLLVRVAGITKEGKTVLAPAAERDRIEYQFAFAVTRRGEKQERRTNGICRDDLSCMVECDGGGVKVEKITGEALLVRLLDHGIRTGACEESSVWVKPGKDDKVFRVEKVPAEQCRALESELAQ